jgi:EmrB/QacA subfamily drug resistance transporter
MVAMSSTAPQAAPDTFLSTRRGKQTLLLLCAVGFLDFVDGSIVNVALPSIRNDLHFSIQNLQWVLSGYVLTYGGFLLLGGRAGDLLGRRRLLVAGTTLFGLSSIASGFAPTSGVLVGARLAQGVGAAMMSPAALSILTTTFNEGSDRLTALGAWGSVGGLASVLGVFLGGVFAGGPGWRWVFFVNPPVCAAILVAIYRLLPNDRRTARFADFDSLGAVLVTTSLLTLIYALVRAPTVGWGVGSTIGELAGAAVLAVAFVVNELRHPRPLVPFSIFKIKGLGAADATQVVAMAGFFSMFFFVTLYMQNVLHFAPIHAGASYVPAGIAVAISATVCSKLFARTGTRPLLVAGAVLAAGGMFWLSRIPVHGSYVSNLLPGLLIMGVGLGAVLVGVQTAAQAGVPSDLAGLAAALITASFQIGSALGLAIFSAIATAHTRSLLAAHHFTVAHAETSGYKLALEVASIFLLAAAAIATRATNTKGEPVDDIDAAIERELRPILDLDPAAHEA